MTELDPDAISHAIRWIELSTDPSVDPDDAVESLELAIAAIDKARAAAQVQHDVEADLR